MVDLNKCSNPECDFCIKGKTKTFCVICGDWNHQFGVNKNNQSRKDLDFLDIVYPYEGDAYDALPRNVIYGICRKNNCLHLLSAFRKMAFVFQCIKEERNVDHLSSDKEIERRVIFYYAEVRHQMGGQWKCDLTNCSHPDPERCWEKSLQYFTQEIYQVEKNIDNFKLYYIIRN